MAPVRLPEFYAMPGSIRLAEELVQTEALPLGLLVSQQPLCAEQCHEPMHIGMLRHQRPVKPTGLVVLAISVVVTLLGAPYFVAHQNHRQTQREYRHGQKVLHLPVSQLLDGRIIGGALDTPIAASVVVRAIAVGFAVQRSEEHTSELQSQSNLVCRLLLEKKNDHQRHWLPRHHDMPGPDPELP